MMEDYWISMDVPKCRTSSIYFEADTDKQARRIRDTIKALFPGVTKATLRRMESSHPGGTDWSKAL
jgi:hypothetical protein